MSMRSPKCSGEDNDLKNKSSFNIHIHIPGPSASIEYYHQPENSCNQIPVVRGLYQ